MRGAIVTGTAFLATAVLALTGTAQAAPGHARIVTTFSYPAGQTPEALATGPGGVVFVSLSEASEVARVTPAGRVRIVGRLPQSGKCPVFNLPISVGLVRLPGGALDVLNCTGNGDTGIWRVQPGQAPREITRLPATSVPNGLALAGGMVYAADSLRGVVWRAPAAGGPAQVWASGTALSRISYIGLNGIYAEGGAIWVDNTDRGTVLRIPVGLGGAAGPARVAVSGLAKAGLDDFTVLPGGTIVMPEELAGRVVVIRPGAAPRTVLTTADGLSDPVDAWVAGRLLLVADSGYITRTPNLLAARW
jgi:hypothetical protein